MSGFAKMMTANRHQQNRRRAPKGFDILLADAIIKLNLNEEQIKELGMLTAKGKIAHATMGNEVYYRRGTLERVFNLECSTGTGR